MSIKLTTGRPYTFCSAQSSTSKPRDTNSSSGLPVVLSARVNPEAYNLLASERHSLDPETTTKTAMLMAFAKALVPQTKNKTPDSEHCLICTRSNLT